MNGRAAAPLVLLGDHWDDYIEAHRHPDVVRPELFRFVRVAKTPAEAARLALDGVPAPR